MSDPSTRAPALAGGSYSGFRPTGVLEGATGLPVGLHREPRNRLVEAYAAAQAKDQTYLKFFGDEKIGKDCISRKEPSAAKPQPKGRRIFPQRTQRTQKKLGISPAKAQGRKGEKWVSELSALASWREEYPNSRAFESWKNLRKPRKFQGIAMQRTKNSVALLDFGRRSFAVYRIN